MAIGTAKKSVTDLSQVVTALLILTPFGYLASS
ncbi:unnamed protein product, partial [marine sediment metagenome]